MRLLTTIFLWLTGIAAWFSGLPVEQNEPYECRLPDLKPKEAPLSPTRPKAEAAVRMPNSQLRAWTLAQCGFL